MKTWTTFGTLTAIIDEPTIPYMFIENELGESRKISRSKYRAQIPMLQSKLPRLMGKSVDIETTQVTATWATEEWFSDVKISSITPKVKEEDDKELDFYKAKLEVAQKEVRSSSAKIERMKRREECNKIEGANLPIINRRISLKLKGNDIGEPGTGNHPKRALARRYGIVHNSFRLEAQIQENVEGNTYKAYLPSYDMTVMACINPASDGYIIKTFKTIDGKYDINDDILLKNDTTKTLKDLADMYRHGIQESSK